MSINSYATAEYAHFIARICVSFVFIWSGLAKAFDFAGGLHEVVALGLPFSIFFLVLTILCQFGGGLVVLLGIWARLGALALAGFTVLATLLAHDFWGGEGAARLHQFVTSLEHLSIVGGLLLIVINGSGPMSLDAVRPQPKFVQ